jgi:hypothetical protein
METGTMVAVGSIASNLLLFVTAIIRVSTYLSKIRGEQGEGFAALQAEQKSVRRDLALMWGEVKETEGKIEEHETNHHSSVMTRPLCEAMQNISKEAIEGLAREIRARLEGIERRLDLLNGRK